MQTLKEKYSFLLLWIISFTVAWSANLLPGLDLQSISGWSDVIRNGPGFLLTGLILGSMTGILQYLFLRKKLSLSFRWVGYSILIYTFCVPGAFLLVVFIISVWHGIPAITVDPTRMLLPPVFLTLIAAGGLVGFYQVITREIKALSMKWTGKLLWILTSALAWGMGQYVSHLFLSAFDSITQIVTNIVFGLTASILTGEALWLLLSAQRRSNMAPPEAHAGFLS